MSLVRLADEADVAEQDRAAVESGREQYGQLLNTWRAILRRPGLFADYLPFLRTVAGPGSLDPQITAVTALQVGRLNHCRYTVSHRYAAAQRVGVDDALLADLAGERWERMPRPLVCALEFTTILTRDPGLPADRAPRPLLPSSLVAELEATFTDAQRVELTMSIGLWNGLARFHRAMDLELDMPAAPDWLHSDDTRTQEER